MLWACWGKHQFRRDWRSNLSYCASQIADQEAWSLCYYYFEYPSHLGVKLLAVVPVLQMVILTRHLHNRHLVVRYQSWSYQPIARRELFMRSQTLAREWWCNVQPFSSLAYRTQALQNRRYFEHYITEDNWYRTAENTDRSSDKKCSLFQEGTPMTIMCSLCFYSMPSKDQPIIRLDILSAENHNNCLNVRRYDSLVQPR